MSILSPLVAFASQAFPRLSKRVLASSGYTLDLTKMGGEEVFDVWDASTAERQDRAWHAIVKEARAGRAREDVDSLHSALDFVTGSSKSLLEVGCGGGYISELINFWYPDLGYHGVDLSEAMIATSQVHYPGRSFSVGSSYDLAFKDSSHDVVLDGVALICMTEWPRALAEYARVAKRFVVLSAVTVTDSAPTTTFAKYAYGQPAIELVFSRSELLAACESLGLKLVRTYGGLDYDLKRYIGIASVSETWVLEV